jgi:hypothetical protein
MKADSLADLVNMAAKLGFGRGGADERVKILCQPWLQRSMTASRIGCEQQTRALP